MRKRIWIVLAAVAVVLVSGGIAWASIPGPDGVIHGCYKTNNPAQGSVIVIDSAASCPSGFTALNWNQTGPAGPQGPPGTSVQRVMVSDTEPQTGPGIVGNSVTCPQDYYVTGGGWSFSLGGITPYIDGPAAGWGGEGTAWQAAGTYGGTGTGDFTVWAFCIKIG
jgi:hypothetical protein